MNKKIAIITPIGKDDYLLNTVIDGLLQLKKEHTGMEFCLPVDYPNPFPKDAIRAHELPEDKFISFAQGADLLIMSFLNDHTNFPLAEKIGRWERTIIIDGTEWGKDRRFNFDVQRETLYDFFGNRDIPDSLFNKAALYFRREKPYVEGVAPFPFGIESRYYEDYDPKIKKNIDFVCIWGQNEHPLLRRHASELLKAYCDENGFTCRTERTKGFSFEYTRTAGRDEFYSLLARAKVGISIGGGGFDTVRFWETLGNNCLLLTERIDIYHPDSSELDYKRIYQFNNLYDFWYQLKRVGEFLKSGYKEEALKDEYADILKRHSTRARALCLIDAAQKKFLK